MTAASAPEITGTSTADQSKKANLSFVLRSISFSHYNEKARWALDYYKVPYVEYRSLPICHIFSMFNHRAKERPTTGGGTKFVTPHLTATPLNESAQASAPIEAIILNNSTKIMQFLSNQYAASPKTMDDATAEAAPMNLYTDDEATATKILSLEERFDKMIGPHIRRYLYYELLLKSPSSVGRSMGQHENAGPLQVLIWTLFFPLIRWILVNFLHINDVSAMRSKDILKREFEQISRVLESGPPGPAYLIGNQFTAADLTLASLGGLVVGVNEEDGYGAWIPKKDNLRPEAVAFCNELKATTAGQHIVECYKLHRGSKAPGSRYGFSLFSLW
ncbi:hypothetical protein EMPS_08094 [Entomortierella parvispora]|uniref:GST C-terminal domain-containing protein n=1 Tax=Entomortierella parvispora TaxID=205924 RepID=A0A9P3HFP8_9FUNG|nr:hypothetical protein EMPS_08094 [Entomortierella parvispora]